MYITPKEAKEHQQVLREQISLTTVNRPIETIAGADLSYNLGSNVVHAGIVVFRFPELQPLARSLVTTEVDFPYIPGLLAFREIPPLEEAWQQLEIMPDVLIMDGHGIAHPRKMGIATHFGILNDQPAIGCAKNVLIGDYEEPDGDKGSYTYLKDEDGDRIGIVLRSRTDVKPIFISPGHKVSFEDCREIVMGCLDKYKLPETTRAAHKLVNQLRRGEIEEGCKELD